MNVEMSLKEALIKYLGQNDFLVKELYYIPVGKSNSIRIYYKPNFNEKNGFHFVVVEGVSESDDDNHESICGWRWLMDETSVSVLVHGIAYFDGIRHIYFGDKNNDGYIFVPNMKEIGKALSILDELTYLHCNIQQLEFKVVCEITKLEYKALASHFLWVKPDIQMFEEANNLFKEQLFFSEENVTKLVEKYRESDELYIDGNYTPNNKDLRKVNWNVESFPAAFEKYFNEKYNPTEVKRSMKGTACIQQLMP